MITQQDKQTNKISRKIFKQTKSNKIIAVFKPIFTESHAQIRLREQYPRAQTCEQQRNLTSPWSPMAK